MKRVRYIQPKSGHPQGDAGAINRAPTDGSASPTESRLVGVGLAPTLVKKSADESPTPQKKHIRYIQSTWILLLLALLVGMVVMPVRAKSIAGAQQKDTATTVGATIYVTAATLRPMFQARINAQVPVAFSNALAGIVSKLPAQDQGWAQQMATTLISPSASLTSLSTQAGGLPTSLLISLYPGDPKPIASSMLVSFSVKSASTVQVTVKPLNGSPSFVSGPLATFTVPIGQLNGIRTAPSCGDAALAVSLNFPISLGNKQASTTSSSLQFAALNASATTGKSGMMGLESDQTNTKAETTATTSPSYVELPSSSLAAIGNSIGSLPISSSQTAKNISVGVSGSNLAINSDIYDSFWGKIGTAQTIVAPTAANGNLAVHVLSTIVKVFGFFTVPYDSYNAQIQQMLNGKLNGALTGKFYVTSSAIGPNSHVPCAASDSLVLTGTANLG